MISEKLLNRAEGFIALTARILAKSGKAREVAILAYSKPDMELWNTNSNWDGPDEYHLYLSVPQQLFLEIESELDLVQKGITEAIQKASACDKTIYIGAVFIISELENSPAWRDKAKAWLSGEGVSNQGRVRSDNLAHRTKDGLLFRSQPEINLYTALKALGISFAPLPVFIRGGETYRRIEPDFIIIKDGIMMAIEVDGDTVHHETPAEAHDRTTMLAHEGVKIERVNASRCDTTEKATKCAQELLVVLERYRTSG